MSERAALVASGYRVIAPSGPVDADALQAGLAAAERLGVEAVCAAADGGAVGLDEAPWLAGGDTDRAERWATAVAARPRGIWMARGGVGAMRVLAAAGERIAVAQGERPVPIWAFSDGTALLADAWTRGWPAWMAPPVVQLVRLDAASLARTGAAMRDGEVTEFARLEVFAAPSGGEGEAVEGPLFAANLAVLASLCGTPWQPDLTGAIVVLEDVAEVGYRVDRLVHQLFHAGVLTGVAGLVWGDFTGVSEAEAPRIGRFLRAFSAECPALTGVPVVGGLPVGHGARNAPLPIGRASGWLARLAVAAAEGARSATLGFRRWR